jgi:hypothetical protein
MERGSEEEEDTGRTAKQGSFTEGNTLQEAAGKLDLKHALTMPAS